MNPAPNVPRGSPHGDALYWTCTVLGWAGYAIIGLLITIQTESFNAELAVSYALYPIYSIGLTHLLRRAIRQWRFSTTRPLWHYAGHLIPAVLAIGCAQTLLIALVSTVFEGRNGLFHQPQALMYIALGTTSATATWAFLYVTLASNRYHREQRTQLQLALREAEISALEAQINPHFLFNCLNSIRALVAENPERAQDMITRLANIFRYNLHRDASHTVPLKSEVEAVGDYLALESVRLEERLKVRFAIAPAAEQALVPPMLLQTLVENALKHGIAPRPSGGDLFIRVEPERDATRIEVENTGGLREPDKGQPGGLGLANTRERLRLLYGDRASFDLRESGGRVIATVLIPA